MVILFAMSMPMMLHAQFQWHWEKGTIVVDTPERAAGQQSALGLRTAPGTSRAYCQMCVGEW